MAKNIYCLRCKTWTKNVKEELVLVKNKKRKQYRVKCFCDVCGVEKSGFPDKKESSSIRAKRSKHSSKRSKRSKHSSKRSKRSKHSSKRSKRSKHSSKRSKRSKHSSKRSKRSGRSKH